MKSIKFNCLILLAFIVALVRGSYEPDVSFVKSRSPAREIKYFDDSPTLLILRDQKIVISQDDGKTYNDVDAIKEPAVFFEMDPYNNKRAFVMTASKKQYYTEDQGKSWNLFEIDVFANEMASIPKVTFNAENGNYLLISNYECPDGMGLSRRCKHKYFYSKDGFHSKPTQLPIDAHVCMFSRSTESSQIGNAETIYCSTNNLNSYGHVVESHLYKSDDFFKSKQEINPLGSATGEIIDIKVEEDFMVAVLRTDKFNENSKISAFISRNGDDFNRADLNIDVKYGVMSFLASSVSSLFLTIMDYNTRRFQTASFYASDSSGLHYTKLLDQVAGGHVQKVQNIDGAWIANVGVDAQKDYDQDKSLLDNLFGGTFAKDIVTKVSFNDGRDWAMAKLNDNSCKLEDGCSLHLWEYGELDGAGKFVTGPTPGILLGVGNKGKHLINDFTKMKTYVSRDAGATWEKALDFPAVFSFGDQGNVILAVPYNGKKKYDPAKHLFFSLDQGKSWDKVKLEVPIYPLAILTTVDGTSRKFIISGVDGEYSISEYIYSVDFSNAFDGKTCNDDDFEEFNARQIDDNEPICVYGHREKFKRRKQDAKCFVNKLFEDVKVIDDPCQCAEPDFECNTGFKLSEKGGHTCVPDPKQLSKMCQSKNELKLKDKVLAQGNKCDMGNKKESDFISEVTINCADYVGDGGSKKPGDNNGGDPHQIETHVNEFEGKLSQYQYIAESEERSAQDNVVVKTLDDRLWISNNGGESFVEVPVSDKILGFYTGPVAGTIILITDSDVIYVSDDGGATFTKQKAPTRLSTQVYKAFAFHYKNANEFIWFGEECENNKCTVNAYYTDDAGASFHVLMKNVKTCEFVGAIFENPNDIIYCSSPDDRRLGLFSLESPSSQPSKIFDNIVGFAMTGNYVVVATIDESKNSLLSKVTVDGSIFADADFPHDLKVESHQAFTVLDSSSKAIFMHVTTSDKANFEFGPLLKSNSNGTYFVVSLDNVNRNNLGYVDFDKIDGLEGTIVANIVANAKDGQGEKKLQTLISHNDGSEWNYLVPPPVDSEGKKYPCGGLSLSRCALHLHGFTERADYRDTYSSGSATGFLIGVGNVGEYLTPMESGATFLSTDGGVTWKEIKKGVYMWEYGDQGTILVLVDAVHETNTILYSLDDGKSWSEFKFVDSPLKVNDLATVPTDTARKFLIFSENPEDSRDTLAICIDFSNIHERQCQLNLDDPEHDDYEYWTPTYPQSGDKCIFGHESKYLRRILGRTDCFIGSAPLDIGYKQVKNCSCTRRDYECDYNYYRDINDNTCKLVKGLSSKDYQKTMCAKENAFQYFESTGYRRIPLSTCKGGQQFDNWNPKACPGKQKEFDEFYGHDVSGNKLFFLIFIPILVFLGSAWFVYDRGIRRNGGFKRLGQIRLDEEDGGFDPIENNQVDVVVNRIVKGGIYTASVVIATAITLRKMDRMLWEKLGNVIFRRSPGHRNYVNVPNFEHEEDELFGDFQDNLDDELEEGRLSSEDFSRRDPFVDGDDDEDEEPAEELERSVATDDRLFDIGDEDEEHQQQPSAQPQN
ncbi:Vacuolar protein sorting/targeting protein 10 [Candida viswanathii]|uniref:Vacuolar protein sorting/targeting protein 10 n=1 Tax=Candida viswanathii TaxID=5486 RepID=A0A367YC89_9ASCO|nr:Vacuolar protein sorting/targeting protein 10 [Candida viswanathii]